MLASSDSSVIRQRSGVEVMGVVCKEVFKGSVWSPLKRGLAFSHVASGVHWLLRLALDGVVLLVGRVFMCELL